MTKFETMKSLILPGDVIQYYDSPWNTGWKNWFNIPWIVAYQGIVKFQRDYFGKRADINTDHVTVYLGPNNILDAKPPKVQWSKIDDLGNAKVKVFRPNFYRVQPRDVSRMITEFESPVAYIDSQGHSKTYAMIGSDYQISQCVDIAINGQLGYPCEDKVELFDSGQNHIVCSVAVRTFFERLRQIIGKETGCDPYKPLFSTINKGCFAETTYGDDIINSFNKFGKVATEMTLPAHFSNSNCFGNEFDLLCSTL